MYMYDRKREDVCEGAMYVCVCHAIRCRDVKDAAGEGACRAADVFRRMQCKPQCGRCLPTIRSMLAEQAGMAMRVRRRAVPPVASASEA